MCHARRFVSWLLALALWSVSGPTGAETVVQGVRIGGAEERTRVVLDLTDKVEFRAFLLADPYRIVVDMSEVVWRVTDPPVLPPDHALAGLRYGLFQPGRSRVVLDARSPLLVHNAFLLEPAAGQSWRLVLDLVPSSRDAFLRAVQTGLSHRQAAAAPRTAPPTPPTESRAPPGPAPPRIQDRRKVVVLDPGHGGVDPGTTGPSGIVEKNLTLEYAQEIKRTLESSGRYRVHLTRNTDVFVRLRERIQLARSVGAEIFLSLHADSLPDAKFRGMTVYTLSDKASDEEAEALAQRENKADVIAGIDLTDEPPEVTTILIDLAQRETMNLSVRLANSLVGEFAREGKMLRQGHRFAGFAVLKAPDVPSILIELGYLSNRQDEAQLAQPAYRKRLSTSILRAIDAYVHARDALKRP